MSTMRLALLLGWQDLRSTYRRSKLGQLWITLGMGVTITTIGLIFGLIFNTSMETYLPFLASGIMCWAFISNTIGEGTQAFVAAESMIKQIPLPKYVHIVRISFKNLFVFGHNLLILPVVLVIYKIPVSWVALLFPVGLLIVALATTGLTLGLSIFATRYRDLGPVISAALGVAFYLTPVIWQPESLRSEFAHNLLGFNPLYHLLQILRLPLLGKLPTLENWFLSLIAAIVFLSAGSAIYSRHKKQISYWV